MESKNKSGDEDAPNPNVICPYCSDKYTTSELFGDVEAMNLGGHIFPCPRCNKPIKIDPFEYFFVRDNLKAGVLRSGTILSTFKPNELTKAESAMRKKKGFWARILGR